jgi:hypothetical protein
MSSDYPFISYSHPFPPLWCRPRAVSNVSDMVLKAIGDAMAPRWSLATQRWIFNTTLSKLELSSALLLSLCCRPSYPLPSLLPPPIILRFPSQPIATLAAINAFTDTALLLLSFVAEMRGYCDVNVESQLRSPNAKLFLVGTFLKLVWE